MRRTLRACGAVLLAAGIMAGFAIPAASSKPAMQRGGFVVLAADFHVHSFPGDGSLAPWDISREAARRGLDVVALTNHNSTLPSRLAGYFAAPTGALLIPSEEVTAVGFHLAAIGVNGTVDWRGTVAQAAAAIHAKGGLAIAAHPAGRQLRSFDAEGVAALDGVEAAHPIIHRDESAKQDLATLYQRATREHPGIAAIGSSDFHNFAPIGLARTFLFTKSAGRDGVFEAVRAGRTVACDGLGVAYGPPVLTALVADDCRRAAAAAPAGAGWADTCATWCVWLGLLLLVLTSAEP